MARCLARLALAVAATATGLAVVLVAGSSPADAHGVQISSDPASGSQVATVPEEIRIGFNEAPELSLSQVGVVNSSADTIETGELTTAPGDDKTLVVPVDALSQDSYTVSWQIVSQVDGHATAGAFSFGIGTAAGAVEGGGGTVTPPLSLWETAGRLTLFAGLVPLIGVATVVPFAFGALVRRAHRRLTAASGFVAVIGLVLLAVAQTRAAGVGLGTYLGTSLGRALIWRALGLAVMMIAIGLALRTEGRRQRVALGLAGVAAAGVVAAHVATGHAGAAKTPALEVTSQWVHVVSIGVWIGGLAVLLAGLRGLSRADRGFAARRFSLLAAAALVAVAGTGIVRTVSVLDRWDSLYESGWGRGVLAKILGLAVLAGMGAINRYRHVPKAAASTFGLRRLGRGELMLSVVVLGAAAVVASTSPPAPAATNGESEPVTASGSDVTTSVRGELTADPGAAGATNTLSLALADFDSGEPIEGANVSLRLSHPEVNESQLTLEEADPGVYTGDATGMSVEGTWEAVAVVQRDLDAVEVPIEIEIAPAQAAPGPDGSTDGDQLAGGDAAGEEAARPGEPVVKLDDPNLDVDVATADSGDFTIYDFILPELESKIRVWFEVLEGGSVNVNVTFLGGTSDIEVSMFDPIEVRATEVEGDDVAAGESIELPFLRDGGGHGSASTDQLTPGDWEFFVFGQRQSDNRPLQVTFPVTVPEA